MRYYLRDQTGDRRVELWGVSEHSRCLAFKNSTVEGGWKRSLYPVTLTHHAGEWESGGYEGDRIKEITPEEAAMILIGSTLIRTTPLPYHVC